MAPGLNQASAPSVLKAATILLDQLAGARRSLTRGITSPVSLCTKTVIGTPQARWRDTTQSGRVSIMPVMRFSPCGGTQRVSSMAFSARARSVPALARVLVHGDEPLRRGAEDHRLLRAPGMRIVVLVARARAISAPASVSAAITAKLASPNLPLSSMTRLPSKPGASLVKKPASSTVKGILVSILRSRQQALVCGPDLEVLGAMTRRGMHKARAGILGDMLAGEQRHVEIVALPAQWMRASVMASSVGLDASAEALQSRPARGSYTFSASASASISLSPIFAQLSSGASVTS